MANIDEQTQSEKIIIVLIPILITSDPFKPVIPIKKKQDAFFDESQHKTVHLIYQKLIDLVSATLILYINLVWPLIMLMNLKAALNCHYIKYGLNNIERVTNLS